MKKFIKRVGVTFIALLVLLNSMSLTGITAVRAEEDTYSETMVYEVEETTEAVAYYAEILAEEEPAVYTEPSAEDYYVEEPVYEDTQGTWDTPTEETWESDPTTWEDQSDYTEETDPTTWEDPSGYVDETDPTTWEDSETTSEDQSEDQVIDGEDDEDTEDEGINSETDEDEDKEDKGEEEKDDEKKSEDADENAMPAKTFIGAAADIKVRVRVDAAEGTFPAGTEMKVKSVNTQTIIDKINDAVEGEVTQVKAVDITFYDKDGKEIQPKKEVKVTLQAEGMGAAAEKDFVHIDDNGKVDVIENVETNGEKAKFDADSFSIYAVVDINTGETVVHQLTYHFVNEIAAGSELTPFFFFNKSGDSVSQQVVKNGDKLEPVGEPYKEGKVFLGWYIINDTQDDYTDQQVVFDVTITNITEDGDVFVAPKYSRTVTITFHENDYATSQEDGNDIILTKQVETIVGTNAEVDVSTITAPIPDAEYAFAGWAIGNATSYSSSTITVTEDVDLFPVFGRANWIRFEANGYGASYTPAVCVFETETLDESFKPDDPHRDGYDFDGWYKDQACTEIFAWEGSLEGPVTLYAKWKPSETKVDYTVLYYQQNANDDGYSLADYEVLKGTAGSMTEVVASDTKYDYFHLKEAVVQKEISGEGDTIVNVYYDRNEYKIWFWIGARNGNYNYVRRVNGNWRANWKSEVRSYNSSTFQDHYTRWNSSSNPFTSSQYLIVSETESGYTYYYIELTARYGADISSVWPTVGIGNLSGSSYSKFNSWACDPNTLYRTISGHSATIKGLYPTMSDEIITVNGVSVTKDRGVTNVFMAMYASSNHAYTYNYYFWNPDINNYPSNPDKSVASAATSAWTSATVAEFEGYDFITKEYGGGGTYDSDKQTYYGGTVNFYYMPKQHNLTFQYNGETIGGDIYYYNQSLSGADKYSSSAEEQAPHGYQFDGWYLNPDGAGDAFDFSTATMPNNELILYAHYSKQWYVAQLDLNGGSLNGNDPSVSSELSWFWVEFGETITKYIPSRDFVQDDSGTYYYHNSVHPKDSTYDRLVYYTTDINLATDTTTTYRRATGVYAFVGWYKVNEDGSIASKPYDFSEEVQGDVKLRARWRRTDAYTLTYNAVVDGKVSATVSQDTGSYADNATTIVPNVSSITPLDSKQYVFKGWSIVDTNGNVLDNNSGNCYKAGDEIAIDANWADDNRIIHIQACYESIEESNEPVSITFIKYNANGGTVTIDADTSIQEYATFSVDGNTIEITGLHINDKLNTYTDSAFAREGYVLVGWNQNQSQANNGVVEFSPGQQIGVDNLSNEANTLYAVWKQILRIRITGNSDTKIYNGTQQEVSGFTVEYQIGTASEWSAGLPSDVSVSARDGAAIVTGTNADTYQMNLNADDFSVTSGDYYFNKATDIILVNGTLKVNPVAIKLTAKSDTKVYDGTALTNNGYDITTGAFVGEDGLASVTVEGSQLLPGTGANTITAHELKEGTIAGNYNISYAPGTLTVTKADIAITVKADDAEKPYDGNPLTKGTASLKEGTLASGDYLVYTVTGTITNAGSETNTLGEVKVMHPALEENGDPIDVTENYSITKENGTLKVNPVAIKLTAKSDETIVYDGQEHEVTGFTSSVDGLTFTGVSAASGKQTDVGTYPVSFSGVTLNETKDSTGNYIVTELVEGSMVISPATTMTVEAVDYSGTYDGAVHYGGATASVTEGTSYQYRVATGETDEDGNPVYGEWSDTAPSILNVGSVSYQVKATNQNYDDATDEGTLTVAKKAVSITVADNGKIYLDPEPTLASATITEYIGEDLAGLDLSVTRETGEDVGSYTISTAYTKEDLDKDYPNYNFTVGTGTFTITPAEASGLGLSVTNYNGEYDGASHAGGATVPESVAAGTKIQYSTDGGKTWTDDAPSITNVGTISYMAKATNPNYADATATGTLIVTPKAVTVTADNKAKIFGEEDPELTAKVEGLLGEDKIEYTISREEGEEVGTYTITPAGEAVQGNYTVTYKTAILTISGTLEVTATDYEGTYDAKAHAGGATATFTEGTTILYSFDWENWFEEAPSITDVGSLYYVVMAVNDGFEEPAYAEGTLTVNPATVTVTAPSATKTVGDDDPEFKATVAGVIDDFEILYEIGREEGEEAGEYAITPVGDEYQGNYIVKYVPGKLTITAPEPEPEPETPAEEPTTPDAPAPVPGGDVTPDIPAVPIVPDNPQPNPPEEPTIDPNPTPRTDPTEPETETIPVDPTPKGNPGGAGTWALLNLILSIVTVLTAIIAAITFFIKKKDDEEQTDDENKKKSLKGLKFLTFIPAVATVILFFLTQDLAGKMIIVDKWTILTAVFTVAGIVIGIVTRNKSNKPNDAE